MNHVKLIIDLACQQNNIGILHYKKLMTINGTLEWRFRLQLKNKTEDNIKVAINFDGETKLTCSVDTPERQLFFTPLIHNEVKGQLALLKTANDIFTAISDLRVLKIDYQEEMYKNNELVNQTIKELGKQYTQLCSTTQAKALINNWIDENKTLATKSKKNQKLCNLKVLTELANNGVRHNTSVTVINTATGNVNFKIFGLSEKNHGLKGSEAPKISQSSLEDRLVGCWIQNKNITV